MIKLIIDAIERDYAAAEYVSNLILKAVNEKELTISIRLWMIDQDEKLEIDRIEHDFYIMFEHLFYYLVDHVDDEQWLAIGHYFYNKKNVRV